MVSPVRKGVEGVQRFAIETTDSPESRLRCAQIVRRTGADEASSAASSGSSLSDTELVRGAVGAIASSWSSMSSGTLSVDGVADVTDLIEGRPAGSGMSQGCTVVGT